VQVDGKQKRVYKAAWTREDAEKALAALLLQVEQPSPKPQGLTLAQAAERYLATKARKRSLSEDKRILKHLQFALGADTRLTDLTASRISEYKNSRLSVVRKIGEGDDAIERGLTAAAVNRPLALLRHLLRLAHEEWEVIEIAPRVRLEKEPQGRLRWLTQEEITRLVDACGKTRNKELRAAVVIALNTGLRLSELLGLKWIYEDLSRGVIRLEVTKSGRRREVPLNDDSYRAPVSLTPKAEGRVFQTRFIKTAYNNAVAIAKLEDVNFHPLRHTFASWAVMRGVTLKELQELLGHSSLAMTMRYAHLAPEHFARRSVVSLGSRAFRVPKRQRKSLPNW
jgi:integrase